MATIARAQDDATETPARSILEDDSDESTSETEEPVELSPTAPADETGESRIRTALETETETTLDPTVPAGEEDETAGARATPPADEMTEGAEPPPLVEGDATAEPLTDPDLAVDPLIESEAEEKAAGDVAEKHHEVISEQREVLEEIEDAAAETQVAVALPEPCTGPWDWVHYSSGEWLRGEFKRMRKKSFELQSTRFDRRTSDWKHIRGFCFKASSRFILYDHTV
ncbi:MAG: hypothetical protein OEV20_10650, partial [Actinomycetota bacterium]|nr:hypothetical protein [Actinomycetota bacterium]